MIDFRQLRYVIAAAEAGSFSRAARNLNIKQATLSRHVLHVEERLGITLFDRRTRGATLTLSGETYLRTARRIAREWEELNTWVRLSRKGEAGRLAVGFYTAFTAGNLRATLTEFAERYPQVHVRNFERGRNLLLTGIESRLLDIAIMVGETTYLNLASCPFWSERIMVVLPEHHPLTERDRIYWPDLLHERFLLTEQDPGPETRSLILAKLGMPGYSPNIEMEDIMRDTALSSLAFSGCISIIAENASGVQIPGVVFRELYETNGHARSGYSGYWREDNDNPALACFLEFVAARYSLPAVLRYRADKDIGCP